MMGTKPWSLAGQSFTFTKKNGEHSLQSNMPANQKFIVVNDEVYERRHVESLRMSDVDDPELYAAFPISEWQKTEKGAWVMKHSIDPTLDYIKK